MSTADRFSRRVFLSVMALGVTAVGMPARAQFKTTKTAAKYQEHPNGDARCERCRHFEPPHSCERVEGEISPNGWCRFFEDKREKERSIPAPSDKQGNGKL